MRQVRRTRSLRAERQPEPQWLRWSANSRPILPGASRRQRARRIALPFRSLPIDQTFGSPDPHREFAPVPHFAGKDRLNLHETELDHRVGPIDDDRNTVQGQRELRDLNSFGRCVVTFALRQIAGGHTNIDEAMQKRCDAIARTTASDDHVGLRISGHERLGARGDHRAHRFRTGNLYGAGSGRDSARAATEMDKRCQSSQGNQDQDPVRRHATDASFPDQSHGQHHWFLGES